MSDLIYALCLWFQKPVSKVFDVAKKPIPGAKSVKKESSDSSSDEDSSEDEVNKILYCFQVYIPINFQQVNTFVLHRIKPKMLLLKLQRFNH